MTTEEYVLARSPLAKDGTYTLLDHMKAMLMTVAGTFVDLGVEVDSTLVEIKVTKAELKVKESIIRLNIDVVTGEYIIDGDIIVKVV